MTMELDADISARLSMMLGRLSDRLDADARDRQRNDRWARQAERMRFVRIHGSVTIPASGFAVVGFDLNKPDQGWLWHLRKLVVGGLTPTIAVAGRADVFVSSMSYGQVTGFGQIGLQDWQDQATSLPLVGTYGDGELVCQESERIHVVLSSATVGQEYVVCGTVKAVQVAAMQQISEAM